MSSLRFTISRRSSGYPKIATVISADLPVVGRRRPGDTLRLAAEAAKALCRDAEHRLTEMVPRLEPIPARPGIDLGSLYDGNLISGVVSGLD
jgi:Carboxyltransferase domain, subdomain A and B